MIQDFYNIYLYLYIMFQRGGVFIKGKVEDAFRQFLHNSTIVLLDSGKSGSVFSLTYTMDPETSPYTSSSVLTWKEPITKIAIKIAAISTYSGTWHNMVGKEKLIETRTDFLREILYQTDIFLKSACDVRPITPAPIYATMSGPANSSLALLRFFRTLIDTTHANMQNTLDEINGYINGIKYDEFRSFGLIAMELAGETEDFFKLYKMKRSVPPDEYELCQNMARLQIVNLAIKTGYLHLDFHQQNILIKTMYMIPVDVLVIDFGRCIKIPEADRARLEGLFASGQYGQLLNEFKEFTIFGIKMGDWLPLRSYTGYEWFWDPSADLAPAITAMENLHLSRLHAMKTKHISDDVYRASIVHLFEPMQREVNIATTPRSILAVESIRNMKEDSRMFSQELMGRRAHMASILDDMTNIVSKKVENEMTQSSRHSPAGGSTITKNETIAYANAIADGIKIGKKNAIEILKKTSSPITKARSLPSRKRSTRSNRSNKQTRRYKSW